VVPTRSFIDDQVIDTLLAEGLLDEELVADVLAIDFTTPVYSRARASLIRFVPDQAKDVADLRAKLTAALRKAPANEQAARALLTNLTDSARTAEAHRKAAQAYLEAAAAAASKLEAVVDWLKIAAQRRLEVEQSETAGHRDGNITEEGFRVIFPTIKLTSKAGALRLDPTTARALPK
jgi:hypothetical protein